MSSPPSSPTETGPEPVRRTEPAADVPRKRSSVLGVALTLGLLALLVWGLTPRHLHFTPAPLDPVTAVCTPSKGEFVPSNITDSPATPIATLPGTVKNHILLRLNMEPCSCGCAQSLASCRISNPECPVSPGAIELVLKEEEENTSSAHNRSPATKR